jgi:hypothetical protein
LELTKKIVTVKIMDEKQNSISALTKHVKDQSGWQGVFYAPSRKRGTRNIRVATSPLLSSPDDGSVDDLLW